MTTLPGPNEWQQEVLESEARLRVVAGGRKVGKTTVCALAAIQYANARVLWLAPNYGLLRYGRGLTLGGTGIAFHKYWERVIRPGSTKFAFSGIEFDLVIVDEMWAVSGEQFRLQAAIMDALREKWSEARWLVVSAPQKNPHGGREVFKELHNLAGAAAWRIPVDENAEWAKRLREEYHPEQVFGNFTGDTS